MSWFTEGQYMADNTNSFLVYKLKPVVYTSEDIANAYNEGFDDGYDSVEIDDVIVSHVLGHIQIILSNGTVLTSTEYYNEIFDEGVDSVDTQGYYDAGFAAGYQTDSYNEGFNDGQNSVDVASWNVSTV